MSVSKDTTSSWYWKSRAVKALMHQYITIPILYWQLASRISKYILKLSALNIQQVSNILDAGSIGSQCAAVPPDAQKPLIKNY